MHRIKKLTLQNFKFFYGKVPINFNCKHLLLYGENGSGKSSIYYALYTFLQSVFKTDDAEIRKYFNPKHDENLINRYANVKSSSALILEMEDEYGTSTTREISLTRINTKPSKPDNLIYETTLGSDFIDHKVLSRIYAYYHKEEIDLFDFFIHHLMAFINFREVLTKPGENTGSKNAENWWKYISSELKPKAKFNDSRYKRFLEDVKRFNTEFDFYLNEISRRANINLEQKFKEKFRIELEYRKASWHYSKSKKDYITEPPKIIMTVVLVTDLIKDSNKKRLDSPQSFLNEAKLSTIALALRLAILDEKFVEAYPKVLVLDDMLMSMDMSNREFILNILLENYQDKYQILFFTHQKGLFEDAKKTIQQHYAKKAKDSGETNTEKQKAAWLINWQAIEMFEGEDENGIPIPKIVPSGNSLQKAIYYFKENIDYSACGNNLRSALEEFFRTFIPSNHFRNKNGDPINEKELMLHELIQHAKKYFALVGFDQAPLDKLDRYRELSLNRASHYNPKTEFYKKELAEIFSLIELLKKNRIIPVVSSNKQILFEIKTQEGKTYSYEATLMDDINVYNKNDGTPNYFVPDDVISLVYTKCLIDGASVNHGQQHKGTLQSIYNDLTVHINKSGTAIIEPDLYKIIMDENGKTLEQLK